MRAASPYHVRRSALTTIERKIFALIEHIDGYTIAARFVSGAPHASSTHRISRHNSPCYAPNSPDLNPIEQSFTKLKAHLRKAKERTVPALYDRIGQALQTFQTSEFPNYFRNSGYAPA